MKRTVTVKSFADLAKAVAAEDRRKAENLRKSAALRGDAKVRIAR